MEHRKGHSVAIDYGKPGGDHTALSVLCECKRLWTVTWPAEVTCKIVSIDCTCGKHIPVGFPDDTCQRRR
jgi:hypothetical protein